VVRIADHAAVHPATPPVIIFLNNGGQIDIAAFGTDHTRQTFFSTSCLRPAPPLSFFMSLAEIEKAVDELSPKELTKLAVYILRRDKVAWDQEIEEDFSPGGKHEKALERIDAEIDSGNFTPLP
jgi:hypothetical protein